jgi:hypothetical protein
MVAATAPAETSAGGDEPRGPHSLQPNGADAVTPVDLERVGAR